MNIYYKVVDVWCKYPFQDEIDYRYCEFYEKTKFKGSKRYKKIEGLRMDSNTSIKEKEDYLKQKLNLQKVTVTKFNN